MDYKRIYESIIKKAKNEDRRKGIGIYYESHHIIPKCLGGSDSKDNRVLLTAKEHFVCHKLLAKIYPSNTKVIYGLVAMSMPPNGNQQRKLSSRDYEYIKALCSESMRGKGNTMYGKSVYDSWVEKHGEEWAKQRLLDYKNKFSEKYSGSGNPRFGKLQKDITKSLIREKALGRKASKETKKKHSENYKKIFGTKEMREATSKRTTGSKNPMYGRSAYDIWLEKYGEEEAKKRKKEADFKKSEFWRKKRLENDRVRK